VFEFASRAACLKNGQACLLQNKKALKAELESRSLARWRMEVANGRLTPAHIKSQFKPASMGAALLEGGLLASLPGAAACDRLRAGPYTTTLAVPGSSRRRCTLCAAFGGGLAHLLAECVSLQEPRQHFLSQVDGPWRSQLLKAPAGDWPPVVLCPHQSVPRLVAACAFGAVVVHVLESA
jgi:hypothetical protein